jgi:hypothetical protein
MSTRIRPFAIGGGLLAALGLTLGGALAMAADDSPRPNTTALAVRSDGTPGDSAVAGEVRGNADEPGHAVGLENAASRVSNPTAAAAIATAQARQEDRAAGTAEDNGVPGEVRGNCDEAEHANEASCAGTGSAPAGDANDADEDVRGPCDEAEHANDPACAPGAASAGNSGRGSANSNRGSSANSGKATSGRSSSKKGSNGSGGSRGGNDDGPNHD